MPTGTIFRELSEKGYTFIRPDIAGKDVFVHVTEFRFENKALVVLGARVHYELSVDSHGRKCATTVVILPKDGPALPPNALTGTVIRYNPVKGFGFIKRDDGSPDVFFHRNDVERAKLGSVNEGDRLAFTLFHGKRISAQDLVRI